VYRTINAHRNVQFSPTDAASASQFQSKVFFDEIEKQLKKVWFLIFFVIVCFKKYFVDLLMWNRRRVDSVEIVRTLVKVYKMPSS